MAAAAKAEQSINEYLASKPDPNAYEDEEHTADLRSVIADNGSVIDEDNMVGNPVGDNKPVVIDARNKPVSKQFLKMTQGKKKKPGPKEIDPADRGRLQPLACSILMSLL